MIGIVLHTACKKLCVAKEFIWEGPEGVESVDIFGKKVFRSRASLGWLENVPGLLTGAKKRCCWTWRLMINWLSNYFMLVFCGTVPICVSHLECT